MKKFILFLVALLPLITFAQERVMVIADPHVMAAELAGRGEAMDKMMSEQRKMLDLSDSIWSALIDTALAHKPEMVLIPGDLTKDGEIASHNVVKTKLQLLRDKGIKVFVIPGNHDMGGSAGYRYSGSTREKVAVLQNSEWESMYDWVYAEATAKDPNSHSYVAEPLKGVTILGIDGAHDHAAIGTLSDATLNWILAQADAAVAKGNMIIALCHWQLLNHIDKQRSIFTIAQLENSESIRNSLMHHGVRLVLTGHFHVSGITSFCDTTGLTNDSIVEITTGSPITYPCPYRWLTLDKNRKFVTVETENLMSLDTRPDLYTYSREWMAARAKSMVPDVTMQLFSKLDEFKTNPMVSAYLSLFEDFLKYGLPQTDAEKQAFLEKHLADAVVDLYILHSEGNEPDHDDANDMALAAYNGIYSAVDEIVSNASAANPGQSLKYMMLGTVLKPLVKKAAEVPIESLVMDMTNWTTDYPEQTDDLFPVIQFKEFVVKLSATNGTISVNPDETDLTNMHYGQSITLTAVPAEGYEFYRWSDGNKNAERVVVITDDITFTAEFRLMQHKVELVADHGSIKVTPADADLTSVVHGTELTLKAVAAEGYNFKGWSDGETKATRKVTINSDTTFTAVFAIKTYNVKLNAENGSIKVTPADTKLSAVEHGSELTLKAVPSEGYEFKGWSDGVNKATRKVTITSDSTFTALFSIKTYKVELVAENGSIDVTPAGAKLTAIEHGTELTLQAVAAANYTFKNWSDGVNKASRKVTITSDTTFTAVFAINTYKVQLNAENGSIKVTPSDTKLSAVAHGTELTLKAVPADNYEFTKWSDGITKASRKAVITSDTTFTALFAIVKHTVTFVDWDEKVLSTDVVEHGKGATPPADPVRDGYTFIGWDPADFSNVTADMTITAQYEKKGSPQDVDNIKEGLMDNKTYDILGRPVSEPTEHGVYIKNGKKIMR